MANDNRNEGKRKVFRQSWKMNPWLKLVRGAWMGVYSVFKIALGALAAVLVIAAVCAVVFVGQLGS